ncbi:MAG: lipopolysaccharide heptosyltransferase I [Desulfarculaceae bacterium]|nr:lipopolysaccharide heptosyltransferase I [Desulfarculaceae bacterium]MCF8072256.1 lipopolysaccharide heptosyltransferase I [Desulfarculaceae bacterium]MCF8100177.1 lipopolysaccharide heptosyltransferase I [Desulfarculaceae bacterium]MCF8117879.1 lipopolysaccharide heptosyltransferase I [Desulfarculaceae bacterium]
MRVLIVKLSALGDVVQSLPVAMAIKRQAPEAQVDWLVERPSAGLLAGHPALNRILVSPRHEMAEADGLPLNPLSRFGRELRAVRYDAVLDLQGLMKSAICVALSRAERKIGWRGGKEPLAGLVYKKRLAPFDPDRPALERYLDMLEPLGLERPAQIEFGLIPSPEELARARELSASAAGEGPLVVLHPVAKWDSKLWPLASWVELAKLLAGRGCRLVVSGSGEDREVGEFIASRAGLGPRLLDLCGRTNLRELAALLSLAQTVVSTDTGVMHLAAAMGAPVVALFGPTAPWRTGPHGTGHRVLTAGEECSPCFERFCASPRCMEGITPQQAAEAAWTLIGKG